MKNILLYLAWYGTGRFFIEGLRTDSLMTGTLKVSQALAAICVVFAVIMLIIGFSRVKRMGRDYKLYCDTDESKALLAEADALNHKSKSKSESEDISNGKDN